MKAPMSATELKPNAFTGAFKPVQIKPTSVSKSLATRVNKNCHAVAWCGMSKSQKAPR